MSMVFDFVQTAAVLVVVAYLLARASFFPEGKEEEKPRGGKRIVAVCVFLFLAFYGHIAQGHLASGVYVDTRLAGVMLAALFFGPGTALFVLVPAAALSVFVGGATLWADLAAMAVGTFLACVSHRRFSSFDAVLAGIIVGMTEVLHMLLIVALVRPVSDAKALVYTISFPSIVINGCAVILFILVIADVYEHRRLWERESFARSENRVAASIQNDLLEKNFAVDERMELTAFVQPALDVGGDLYSFTLSDGHSFRFLVGDVSGKGVPAAIFMSRCETLFSELASRSGDPAEILTELNRRLGRRNQAQMFVTAWAGVLDLETGRLVYSNAGHVTPYLLRKGTAPEALPRPMGLPLGLFPGEYLCCERQLAAGETVLTYSDGVTEAENQEGVLFGSARLEAALTDLPDVRPDAVRETLLRTVRDYTAGAKQSDDITVFAFALRERGGEPV